MTETWLAPYLDRMEELSRHFFRYFHARIEAEGGLSPSQFFVLKLLRAGGTLTVSDLAQKLSVSTAGATGLLDRLVRAGLVERTRDEGDRRIVWVRLSAEGVRQFTEAGRIRRAIMAELFAPLTPEEAQQLVYLYEKVAGSIAVPGS
ncbi:MAG TPA: MarR family transcriptional regulator, partial [Symbiobacteriaceae bacterium]|nr:MarR family transcriptional regulator [Symbiobacteriaceae bacterium]